MRVRALLEQVFFKRGSGGIEAQLVFERESGARERSSLTLATFELAAAARLLGRTLARRDDVAHVARCRVRVQRGADLSDDELLRDALRAAFREERRRLRGAA